jgi:ADP-ribose pyrophosphatase
MAVVFKGRVFNVEVEQRTFPNGSTHEVTIVRHAPSVVLLPILDDGRVMMVRQYRASVDRELWEVPAGSLNPDEAAEDAAIRECEEEIRLVPGRLRRIRGLYPAPGFCDEELIFFVASELRPPSPDSTRRPDEDEDILARPFTLEEARAMVARGEIVDLKTAYALTLV